MYSVITSRSWPRGHRAVGHVFKACVKSRRRRHDGQRNFSHVKGLTPWHCVCGERCTARCSLSAGIIAFHAKAEPRAFPWRPRCWGASPPMGEYTGKNTLKSDSPTQRVTEYTSRLLLFSVEPHDSNAISCAVLAVVFTKGSLFLKLCG